MQIKNITKSISMNSSFAVRRLKFKITGRLFLSSLHVTDVTIVLFRKEQCSGTVCGKVHSRSHVYRNMVRRCQTQKPLDKKEKNK